MTLPEGLSLETDENGLFLSSEEGLLLRADFAHLKPRLKHHNLSGELVVKASRIKGREDLHVLDATAGLGEDSFLLAAAGFIVDLYEYDPVIAALLKDAVRRALMSGDEILRETAMRMNVYEEDSIAAMRKLSSRTDVILLDPMFPERKKTGLIKKKFQLLQQLERPCEDEEALLEAACSAGPDRVVVKRPQKGPYLANRKPDYSLPGKTIRYDVYLLNKRQKDGT
ncbi:MAG: class I SAM-dependent methyltransferase [Lachnospiraceae bacterium]|nr:class I SAM-dependent methyltransferase [Lachnospiraceae bacterium]